jgi:hypothetical protein
MPDYEDRREKLRAMGTGLEWQPMPITWLPVCWEASKTDLRLA